jgi:hypothetical protein
MTIKMKDEIKELLQYFLCVFCIVGAMVMSFIALYLDPTGEIHESVLWLIAQVLVFCGSLMGINTLNSIQLRKIGSMSRNKEQVDEKD